MGTSRTFAYQLTVYSQPSRIFIVSLMQKNRIYQKRGVTGDQKSVTQLPKSESRQIVISEKYTCMQLKTGQCPHMLLIKV